MMLINLDGLDIEYVYEPDEGDGWNDEHFSEHVIIESIIKDGQEIIDQYSDIELDDLAEKVLNIHLCERYDCYA